MRYVQYCVYARIGKTVVLSCESRPARSPGLDSQLKGGMARPNAVLDPFPSVSHNTQFDRVLTCIFERDLAGRYRRGTAARARCRQSGCWRQGSSPGCHLPAPSGGSVRHDGARPHMLLALVGFLHLACKTNLACTQATWPARSSSEHRPAPAHTFSRSASLRSGVKATRPTAHSGLNTKHPRHPHQCGWPAGV